MSRVAQAQAYRILGVDIGNSGLRIAELNPINDLETKPGYGPADDPVRMSKRISWLHPSWNTGAALSPQHDAKQAVLAEMRYRPDSPQWLEVVSKYLSGFENNPPVLWLVSSVRRDALALLEHFVAARSHDHWRVVSRHDLPLQVDVLEPDKVGIDRLLAAAAAANMFDERPLIVMQAGSALTVDLVCNVNTFCGGAILPGIPMMLRLLGQAADMLPQIDATEITELPPLPGRDTEQAMRCGTASALVGGAQHLIARYRQTFGADTLIVLSGGDGLRLAQHLTPPLQIVPHLVLRGLLPLVSLPT